MVGKKIQIKPLTFLVVIISLLSFRPSLAQEKQSHWLIGRWDGMLEDPSRKDGLNRTLRVFDVTPDNKAPAFFARNPLDTTRAECLLEGAKIKVVTLSTKRVVELTREGDESLVGTFTDENGRQFPIRLTKMKPSSEFDGEWEGKAYTRPCARTRSDVFFFRGNYQLTIRNSQITGKGVFYLDNTDGQHMFRWSIVTGQVESDGVGVLVQTPLQAGGASGFLLGKFTGNEFLASQTRGLCAYDVKLNRK